MKFLFISPRFTGGTGNHASMLAEQLSQHGHKVTKMSVPHLPIKNLKNPSFAIFGTLKSLLSREHYDIVHAFNVPSAFAMHFAKGTKKVLSIHGVFSDQVAALHSQTTSSIANVAELKALHWADKLTTDSKKSKEDYKKKFNFDFEYLPTPIDTKMFNLIPDSTKNESKVIYVGRNSFEKGIDILQKIEDKINGDVVYCVDVPWKDAMSSLKSSSILVVPSRMESLPTIIKEAFYLKIPVIAFGVGGIPELITNGKTGILVEPNNSDILLTKINELLDNKQLRTQLASNAFDEVQTNFTWDVTLPKYIKFYESLLNS